MSLSHPGQVRRRHKHAQSPIVFKREVALEPPIELAWRVVARPDGMPIHPNRHDVAGKPYFHSRPVPPSGVMGYLPWAPATDHCEHKGAAGLQQTRACSRYVDQVGYAIERTKIGICPVERAFTLEPLKFMSANDHCLHSISD